MVGARVLFKTWEGGSQPGFFLHTRGGALPRCFWVPACPPTLYLPSGGWYFVPPRPKFFTHSHTKGLKNFPGALRAPDPPTQAPPWGVGILAENWKSCAWAPRHPLPPGVDLPLKRSLIPALTTHRSHVQNQKEAWLLRRVSLICTPFTP